MAGQIQIIEVLVMVLMFMDITMTLLVVLGIKEEIMGPEEGVAFGQA